MIDAQIFDNSKNTCDFPKLMISNSGCVILTTAEDQSTKCITGTVVKSLYHRCGIYLTNWETKHFRDFYEYVTLQNTF